jgi:hypothetical protein
MLGVVCKAFIAGLFIDGFPAIPGSDRAPRLNIDGFRIEGD